MPYKDPKKQRDYQRAWARSRVSTKASKSKLSLNWRLETADDIRCLVESTLSELMNSEELDLGIKARLIFKGAEVSIRLLEVSSMEERLEKLEARIFGKVTA